jgi:hypothetical protein
MSAVLEELMEAPELALWEEKIAARLREEHAKREQFYRDITPSMKAEFINGGFVLHSPATVKHNFVPDFEIANRALFDDETNLAEVRRLTR